MSLFGRRKYVALLNERQDRVLTEREEAFLDRYRADHPECVAEESLHDEGFAMLRGLGLDEDPAAPERFEHRVIRRWRVQSVKDTAAYWSPAICGALVAAIALLAMFQLVGRSSTMPPIDVTGNEARRLDPPKPVFPSLPNPGEPIAPR
ncbi:MAG TPA: hypothetical protein PLL78_01080 [Fimbriimonadaceae bacterium]|nr:hypothetical protein [Fimbriimonadaceae bacterium]HRJ95254.1 hypothetical protein [Fimbriimonadaceae bacterium]